MKIFAHKIWPVLAMVLAISPLRADTLVFANGDRLTGKLVEQTSDTIRFSSNALGVITVPAAQAQVETDHAPATPPPSATPASSSSKPADKNKSPVWVDDFKKAVNFVIPGEVSGRLDAGITNTRTSSATTQVMAVGNLTVKDQPSTYDLKGFYYYTATRAADGTTSRSADRYGSDASYRRDLDERLFVTNESGYLRDFQANINHQAQDTVNGGYVLWKSKDISLSLQAGPTERYVDAYGIDPKWRSLGSGKQILKWQLTDSLRLEQDAHALAQVDDLNSQAWNLNAALISQLDGNLELSLRFSQSYNTIVGLNGARSEQLLALALGIKF